MPFSQHHPPSESAMPDLPPAERQFGIGRVVSQTFGVIRRNLGPVLLLCALSYGTEKVLDAMALTAVTARFPPPQPL